MAKNGVDGVYTADPQDRPGAMKFDDDHLPRGRSQRGLKVADATAFSLCMDNRLPIIVFDLLDGGQHRPAVRGERIGTLVSHARAGPRSRG